MGHISGNFNTITKKKPKNWIEKGYKIMIPFKFKWRHKIGNVVCDCKECLECYKPYYGFDIYHSKDCAIMILLDKRPQIQNLRQYQYIDLSLIASIE
jgi:hypothetical protein